MCGKFKICVLLAFLLPSLCPAQEPTAITISVHDYAGVSAESLAKAQAGARRIFQQAGVQTIWLNCSPKLELEKIEPANCSLVDSTHLLLKVLQAPKSKQVGKGIDVLGTALLLENSAAYYAYAYYGRIQHLAERRKLGSALLAAAFVHEIGHLLLQSNSHSPTGIICARWSDEELRKISEGIMYFTPTQSSLIQGRVEQLRLARTKDMYSLNSSAPPSILGSPTMYAST